MASQNTDKYAFNVVGGPSKFDLMVSLFEGNPKDRRTVAFKLEGLRQEIKVAITGVQQEDGSGESWNIEGWVMGEPSAHVKVYYCSRGRSGFFRFVIPTNLCWNDDKQVFVETVDVAKEKKLSDALAALHENINNHFTNLIRNARRM
jgi:hypothetical protein